MSRPTSFQKVLSCFVCLLMIGSQAYAAELDYPELLVTPRASERIEMELKEEPGSAWLMHLPIQLGALSQIAGGVIMLADVPNQRFSVFPIWAVPMGIGGAWLGLSIGLAAAYRPYARASEAIGSMPRKTRREELLRERMSEERIAAAAAMGWRLTILSTVTQAMGGLALAGTNQMMSPAFFTGVGATLLSFAPLIFQYRWIRVNRD